MNSAAMQARTHAPGSGTRPNAWIDVAAKLKLVVQLLGKLGAVILSRPRLAGANFPMVGSGLVLQQRFSPLSFLVVWTYICGNPWSS